MWLQCGQAVKQLEEQVAALPEGACADLLILPLYAAMPLELQARAAPPPCSLRAILCVSARAAGRLSGYRVPPSRPARCMHAVCRVGTV